MKEQKLSNHENNLSAREKVVTIKIKDLQQLKIILATWYSYLISKQKESAIDFQEAIKTPIIYNIDKDELELLITGTEDVLKELNLYIQNLNRDIKNKNK